MHPFVFYYFHDQDDCRPFFYPFMLLFESHVFLVGFYFYDPGFRVLDSTV